MIGEWTKITVGALGDLWEGFLNFIPELIGAIIVFVIGWLIAAGVGKLVERILDKLSFNKLFEKEGWKEALARAEMKVDVSKFLGAIVKWVLVIVFLLASVEILGLIQFADFLKGVLNYLPNVIVAVLIFVATFIVVDIIEKLVRASVERIKIGYGNIVSLIVKWSIWIFAIFAILRQLLIVPQLIDVLFRALVYGVVALVVISAGIAFGLGGKNVAAQTLEDLRRRIKGE